MDGSTPSTNLLNMMARVSDLYRWLDRVKKDPCLSVDDLITSTDNAIRMGKSLYSDCMNTEVTANGTRAIITRHLEVILLDARTIKNKRMNEAMQKICNDDVADDVVPVRRPIGKCHCIIL